MMGRDPRALRHPRYLSRNSFSLEPLKTMDLKITGTVRQVLEEASGEGRNGPWRKQEYILETAGNYPKSICLVVWGDNIDQFGIREGEQITASIDIQSREYNGRWYTDVKAWKLERDSATDRPPSFPADEPNAGAPGDEDDDLPF